MLTNKTKYETPSEIAIYLNNFDILKNLMAKLGNNIYIKATTELLLH